MSARWGRTPLRSPRRLLLNLGWIVVALLVLAALASPWLLRFAQWL